MKRSSRRILTHISLDMVGRVAEEVPGIELVENPGSGPIPPEAQGEILLTARITAKGSEGQGLAVVIQAREVAESSRFVGREGRWMLT